MFSIITQITNQGKQRYQNMLLTGESFKLIHFTVGQGGHDPLDPRQTLTPDPSAINLPLENTTFLPKPFETINNQIYSGSIYNVIAELDFMDAIGSLSNLGIWGQIIFDGTSIVTNGAIFLFSMGNFPLQVKTTAEQKRFICSFQF